MKIGILTYHYAYNFGANLQVLSTVYALKNRGYNPIVIDWRPEDIVDMYQNNTQKTQAFVHEKFVKDHLPLSSLCKTSEDIARLIETEDIQCIIVGSDAVLNISPYFSRFGYSLGRRRFYYASNQKSVNLIPNPFWGSFIDSLNKKIPCVMMSVSSQNTPFHLMSIKQIKTGLKCINNFSYISVRDNWTKKMIRWISMSNIDPEVTPDPVFSFNNNVPSILTDKIILEKFNLPDKYILVSFKAINAPPTKWVNEFHHLAKDRGYNCVAFPYPQELNEFMLPYKIDLPLNPLEWYTIIKNADGYIGHNMHPIVTCIHNSVPFYSFDNYGHIYYRYFVNKKSSKIYDLLKFTGFLENSSNVQGQWPLSVSPRAVIEHIDKFDIKQCNKVASIMTEKYYEMIDKIEIALKISDMQCI